MVKKLVLFFVAAFFVSCSVTTNLSQKYVGRGVEVLYKEKGTPSTVAKLDNGNKLFTYVKETIVRETEISTGRGTLDPRISPSFIKIETYCFEVNANGIIVQTDYKKRIQK
jgi:hypothetical protein